MGCRGCDVAQALYVLQDMTARDPYWAQNWNALGVWLGELADLTSAWTCMAISERLLDLKGFAPDLKVHQNFAHINNLMASQGARMNSSSLWSDGGLRLTVGVRRALHVQDSASGYTCLLEDHDFHEFVQYLVTGTKMA